VKVGSSKNARMRGLSVIIAKSPDRTLTMYEHYLI